MITNPPAQDQSLIIMVAAFADMTDHGGLQKAIKDKYRFYSGGDATC